MPTPPDPNRRTPPTDGADLDPPSLQSVGGKGIAASDGLIEPDSPLQQYVHNEAPDPVPWATPDEAGIVRDNPFGETGFGGETPFFTGSSTEPAFAHDDTEGIPTGLPWLLELPDVPDVVVQNVPIATGSHTPEPPIVPRISRTVQDGPSQQAAFLVGLGVASAGWILVLGIWLAVTFQ